MIIYIRGGAAGKLFQSVCNECNTYFNWDELVVQEYDFGEIKERNCIPCHEDKYSKLNVEGWNK